MTHADVGGTYNENGIASGNSKDLVLTGSGRFTAIATNKTASTLGAIIEITNDPVSKIVDGTAVWLESERGVDTNSFSEASIGSVSGVRLVAKDAGIWDLNIRQEM